MNQPLINISQGEHHVIILKEDFWSQTSCPKSGTLQGRRTQSVSISQSCQRRKTCCQGQTSCCQTCCRQKAKSLVDQEISCQSYAVDNDQEYTIGHQAKTSACVASPGTADAACDKNSIKWYHWNVRNCCGKYHSTYHTASPGKNFSTKSWSIAVPICFDILPYIGNPGVDKIHYANPNSTARL